MPKAAGSGGRKLCSPDCEGRTGDGTPTGLCDEQAESAAQAPASAAVTRCAARIEGGFWLEDLRRRGEFLEHAQVFDNLYGTGRETVERLLAAGTSVVLEIDWQGAQQVRKAMPESITIFILPPSLAALRERLQKRQTDSPEVIARRFGDAVGDVSHWSEFQYVVVNEDFERAVSDLARIVAGRGEDLRASRPGLDRFVEALLPA